MKRRDFLRNTSLASMSMMVPGIVKAGAKMMLPGDGQRILVIIQLSGGNDGLNTVVPFQNDLYYEARPQIAIRKEDVLLMNQELGLHPALLGLKDLYEDGELSVINSVGYPNPNRSHFRSMDIWQTASGSDEFLQTGWIGRYLDASCGHDAAPYHAIEVGNNLSLALKGQEVSGLAAQNPERLKRMVDDPFIRSIAHEGDHHHDQVAYLYKTLVETASSADYVYEMSNKHTSYEGYPLTDLGKSLKTMAELIISGSDTRVYYASHGGFDTHVNQTGAHERLLTNYSEAVAAFSSDLKKHNRWKDVCVMTFSEFGRRVKQNAGRGTDHGTANNVFLMGGNLTNAGIYNDGPDLSDLDSGDLKFKVDFRDVYADLMQNWMRCEAKEILGRHSEAVKIFS
jgi:uncharacterized protein (DUF1501 family)